MVQYGFSKKLENHAYAVAIHYMYYNFCRVHQTLCVTPAMEAKMTDHVWSLQELLGEPTHADAQADSSTTRLGNNHED